MLGSNSITFSNVGLGITHIHSDDRQYQRDAHHHDTRRYQGDVNSQWSTRYHHRDARPSHGQHNTRHCQRDVRAHHGQPRKKRQRVQSSSSDHLVHLFRCKRRRQPSSSSLHSSATTFTSTSSLDSSSSRDGARRGKRHSNGRLTRVGRVDGQLSIACTPPLGHKLLQKIKNGEYVNFDKLLSEIHSNHPACKCLKAQNKAIK